jgi:anti-sigma factor RsiW
MNEGNRELLEGLRALAAEGPSEAPRHIEERLKAQFRRQNRRRNLMAWAPAFSVAAAAGIALLLWSHSGQTKPVVPPAIVAANTVAAHPVVAAAAADEEADASFYPLPEAEALPAVETAMVVRVQLPVSSLQLMGVPVDDGRADASVQAELLLGQDGLARAVRLAQ